MAVVFEFVLAKRGGDVHAPEELAVCRPGKVRIGQVRGERLGATKRRGGIKRAVEGLPGRHQNRLAEPVGATGPSSTGGGAAGQAS